MKVLVACEESQEVCKAFREKGHEAYSCDIQECSGGHPEWHIIGDCIPLLNGNCSFITEGGTWVVIDSKWDLLIAHPPCTYLTVSGNAWFNVEKYGKKAEQRWKDRVEAAVFFMKFVAADCDHIAIENPVGIMGTVYRKADQIIQPYQFGHHAMKTTCLWLKGLPKLTPTEIVDPGEFQEAKTGSGRKYNIGSQSSAARDENGKIIAWNDPRTAKARSKTYTGIAKAFAEQWNERSIS
jgi:hypothetical protein